MSSYNIFSTGPSLLRAESSGNGVVCLPMKRKDSPPALSSNEPSYFADRESCSDGSDPAKPNKYNHEIKRQRSECGDDEQKKAEEKLLREAHYDAKHALDYIRATRGQTYVPPSIGRSTLFNGKIDLTSIKHIVSSKVSHSHHAHNQSHGTPCQNENDNGEIPEVYCSLVDATRPFYPYVTSGERDSELSDNSSTGTGDYNKDGGFASVSNEDSTRSSLAKCHPLEMTLDAALSLCQDPRIVTKAREPYSVVHVNAAFCKLFGATGSHFFLSRPLNEVLNSESGCDHTTQLTKYLESSLIDEKHRLTGDVVRTGSLLNIRAMPTSLRVKMTLLGLVLSDEDSAKKSHEQVMSMKAFGHCMFGLNSLHDESKSNLERQKYFSVMG